MLLPLASLTLAALTSAASAISVYNGNATLYTPSKYHPGACGSIVASTDRVIALPPSIFNASLCGQIVAIENTESGFGGEVSIADCCDACEGTDFKLPPAAFASFLNATEQADGVTTFPAEYVLGLLG
ncbi:hypothetical protein C8F01DRAFT_1260599 [Mycena amicta]|nr:hypothetical protein C8F01DRAFT_1260599 [Mycena amicta]